MKLEFQSSFVWVETLLHYFLRLQIDLKLYFPFFFFDSECFYCFQNLNKSQHLKIERCHKKLYFQQILKNMKH